MVHPIDALVGAYLDEHGVPLSMDDVYRMTVDLYPTMERLRAEEVRAEKARQAKRLRPLGVKVAPGKVPEYAPNFLFRALASRAMLTPEANAVILESLDPASRATRRVVINEANRRDPAVVDHVRAMMTARLERHVLAAGRDFVVQTAERGTARYKDGRPARIGYARVLTGRESCPFCTMLASRGPVYKEDTVLYRKDGRKFHDHCDCIAALVVEGEPWEGESTFKRLRDEWHRATWRDNKPVSDQLGAWAEHVRSGALHRAGILHSDKGSGRPKLGKS